MCPQVPDSPTPDAPINVASSASVRQAVKIARRWQGVPSTMSDDEALAKGFITPQMIELVLAIITELMQNCFSNRPASAWGRVRSFIDNIKPLDTVQDRVRLSWIADRWMSRLGFARDRGDVVEIREALIAEANDMKETEFNSVQLEVLFLTV